MELHELQEQIEALQSALVAEKEKLETARIDADEARDEVKRKEASTSKAVYVSPGRILDVFQGKPIKVSEPNVQDWVADVRAQLEMRSLAPKGAVAFIKEHLAGYARKEINGRGKEVENNPNRILEILLHVFGDGNNLPQLQQKFFTYKQSKCQDLLSLSLELVSLYDTIVTLDVAYKPCREASLKSRLAEAVLDSNLQRELRRLNIESPQLTYFQLRDRAVAWLGDVERSPTEATVKTVSAETKILELLRKQNSQIETQQRQINVLHEQLVKRDSMPASWQPAPRQEEGRWQPAIPTTGWQPGAPTTRWQQSVPTTGWQPGAPTTGWQQRPERRCYGCDEIGHMKRDCPSRTKRSNNHLNEVSPTS